MVKTFDKLFLGWYNGGNVRIKMNFHRCYMIIKMFNFWYFFWIIICAGIFVGLYFLLRNKSDKTKKITLFSILLFALALHFLKCFFPPYSTDRDRLYRDIFFINICGANIFLFSIFFLTKSKVLKDYMFYLGLLGGGIALFYPAEPMLKAEQNAEVLDIIRFYIHHAILCFVPLLMVLLKLHKLDYKRVWSAPVCLLGVMLFIMLNQVLQSELGFVPLRGDNIFDIGYKNSSYIWGPDDAIGNFIAKFCPKWFTSVPAGAHAGEMKYWPWVWMIFPVFLLLTPVAFLICLPFDFKNLKKDVLCVKEKCKTLFEKKNDTKENKR